MEPDRDPCPVYPLGPSAPPGTRGRGPTFRPGPKTPATRGTWSFPFVEVYGPDVRVRLATPDGRKGAIVGPYSVVQEATTPKGTVYKTLAKPTGAQVAIAWNCDALPGTVPP